MLTIASLICSAVQSGWAAATSAAVPATCGVAIEVPLIVVYIPEPRTSCERAARTSTPGAVISGLTPPSTAGPVLEKSARVSVASTAPTARAESARAGVLMVCGPPLPAAVTNSAPVSAVSSSTAVAIGSSAPAGSPPRLMLTMRASWSRAAHSMPAMIQDSMPRPLLSSTRPTCSRAPGATPRSSPSEAAPVPAIVEATCVPCPW